MIIGSQKLHERFKQLNYNTNILNRDDYKSIINSLANREAYADSSIKFSIECLNVIITIVRDISKRFTNVFKIVDSTLKINSIILNIETNVKNLISSQDKNDYFVDKMYQEAEKRDNEDAKYIAEIIKKYSGLYPNDKIQRIFKRIQLFEDYPIFLERYVCLITLLFSCKYFTFKEFKEKDKLMLLCFSIFDKCYKEYIQIKCDLFQTISELFDLADQNPFFHSSIVEKIIKKEIFFSKMKVKSEILNELYYNLQYKVLFKFKKYQFDYEKSELIFKLTENLSNNLNNFEIRKIRINNNDEEIYYQLYLLGEYIEKINSNYEIVKNHTNNINNPVVDHKIKDLFFNSFPTIIISILNELKTFVENLNYYADISESNKSNLSKMNFKCISNSILSRLNKIENLKNKKLQDFQDKLNVNKQNTPNSITHFNKE